VVVKPTSRGQVTLRSPVPHARPRIVHNYLQTEDDRQSMIAGTRLNFEIHAAPALKEWRRGHFLLPESGPAEGHIGLGPPPARTPSTTRSAPPPWGRSSTRSCASSASRACASSTPR